MPAAWYWKTSILIVHEGEAVALLGRNGVGKTTTLRAITGTVRSSAGSIILDGADITNAPSYEINQRGISLVPEGRRLFPNLTTIDNLRLAARPGGASLEEVFTLFPKLRILQRSKAESLSGGERQMLAIARALMVPARVILLDEPFEGLAPAVVKEVMDALVRLRGRVSMVIVEHHAETVLPIVDRAYVLVNGQRRLRGQRQGAGGRSRLAGAIARRGAAGTDASRLTYCSTRNTALPPSRRSRNSSATWAISRQLRSGPVCGVSDLSATNDTSNAKSGANCSSGPEVK